MIGIDEAGYGPTLGPLVVAASLWRCAAAGEPVARALSVDDDAFAGYSRPVILQDGAVPCNQVHVDDSKRIFKSKSNALATLHRIVSVAHYACGRTEPTLEQRLKTLVGFDYLRFIDVPWLAALADGEQLSQIVTNVWTPIRACQPAISQWSRCPWRLIDVQARMIDAGAFNRFIQSGAGDRNKSDLLTQTSLSLARDMIASLDGARSSGGASSGGASSGEKNEAIQIFFDRHGGRKFYAGPIQQIFDRQIDAPLVRVIAESNQQSVYEIEFNDRSIRLHFTVKGDRFVPVALSSLHAKYLREISMAVFNDFFQKHYARNETPTQANTNKGAIADECYVPTAGYPSDARRFMKTMTPLIDSLGIDHNDLVRCR